MFRSNPVCNRPVLQLFVPSRPTQTEALYSVLGSPPSGMLSSGTMNVPVTDLKLFCTKGQRVRHLIDH
jgi:hypothetical protein